MNRKNAKLKAPNNFVDVWISKRYNCTCTLDEYGDIWVHLHVTPPVLDECVASIVRENYKHGLIQYPWQPLAYRFLLRTRRQWLIRNPDATTDDAILTRMWADVGELDADLLAIEHDTNGV